MSNCVFCKIIAGELPGAKVYEDDKILAFLDINPINYGHTLVIPKEHYETLVDLPDELLKEVILVVKKIGQAVIAELRVDGFNIGLNNGKAAGQLVDHVHFHVIPREVGDGLKHWPSKDYEEGEMDSVAEKIKQALK
ncbi:MAG: HIT family protein [Parcubacteria group bacterium]|nr:HIT family protein [Parcubacteria group bacterium]